MAVQCEHATRTCRNGRTKREQERQPVRDSHPLNLRAIITFMKNFGPLASYSIQSYYTIFNYNYNYAQNLMLIHKLVDKLTMFAQYYVFSQILNQQ